MKYLRLFEGFDNSIYDIKDIYSWWSGIDVEENDEWYIINLDIYLKNKIIQLNHGLKDKTVYFYCKYDKKYELLKIKSVDYLTDNGLIFKCEDIPNNTIHIVDTTKPIKISKTHIEINKYNL